MQDPLEESDWYSVLRAKGIVPARPKIKSNVNTVDVLKETLKQKQRNKVDKVKDGEVSVGSSEADALNEGNKRLADLLVSRANYKFGLVRDISGPNYMEEVNNAGEGVWVVLHLYKKEISQCTMINYFLRDLAPKFPDTKFIKSIAKEFISEKNLPVIFIYMNGLMKKRLAGPDELGRPYLNQNELEYLLGQAGAIPSEIKDDPGAAWR